MDFDNAHDRDTYGTWTMLGGTAFSIITAGIFGAGTLLPIIGGLAAVWGIWLAMSDTPSEKKRKQIEVARSLVRRADYEDRQRLEADERRLQQLLADRGDA